MRPVAILLAFILPATIFSQPAAGAPALPHEWPLHGGGEKGQHFSRLEQINRDTVEGLGLDWSVDLSAPDGIAATPIVMDGVIYLSGPNSVTWAIDAESGRKLWTFDPKVSITDANDWTGRVNRGVAVWGDRVLVTVSDCRLIALDRASGVERWSQLTCDPQQGYSISDAPHVGGGKVFVGNAGSEKGTRVRGYVTAYDAMTGRFLWRFYTVPSHRPKENTSPAMKMAYASWSGDALEKFGGGGSNWNEMTYDPDTGLLYFGTAGALPYVYSERSPEGGDNLFTSSVLAVRGDTGEYVWHYQTVPQDSWEYNATNNIVLADLEIGGQSRRTLLIAPKNGFFYVLDRTTGELLSANHYVKVNWATHIDLETGRPVLNPEGMYWKAPPETRSLVWPNMWGAHSTQPMAFHPGEQLVYIPAVNLPDIVTWHGDGEFSDTLEMLPEVDGGPHVPGMLVAWDPLTQSQRWSVPHAFAFNGGVLTTAGGLVFQGDANGQFSAYDARTGQRLWSALTGSAISAAPVTYALGERQRILIAVGTGGGIQFIYPGLTAGPQTTGKARLMSFSLNGKAPMPDVRRVEPALPDLPPPKATAGTLQAGSQLYQSRCAGCHGKSAVARFGGTVPDLRYMSRETQLQWNGIVIGGAQVGTGMPAFELTNEEAGAIRAYVLSRAQELSRKP